MGSRHYQGAGLGQVGIWGCPSCGADNTGPLEQGCSSCGAGRPGPARPPEETPPPPPTPAETQARQGDFATLWAERYPEASIADAYRAGYLAGLRASRQEQGAAHAPRGYAAPPPAPRLGEASTQKTYRTLIVALALFRDQILSQGPEEIQTGEWLSVEDTNTVIAQLQQSLEVAHV